MSVLRSQIEFCKCQSFIQELNNKIKFSHCHRSFGDFIFLRNKYSNSKCKIKDCYWTGNKMNGDLGRLFTFFYTFAERKCFTVIIKYRNRKKHIKLCVIKLINESNLITAKER